MTKVGWRLSLLLLALFSWALAPASVAEAHAELLAAVPAPGAVLSASPGEVRLTFSEQLAAGSKITLYGEGFSLVPGVAMLAESQSSPQMAASVPALPPGAYSVQWTALGSDGHEVNGSYWFNIEPGSDGSSSESLWWIAAAAALVVVIVLFAGRRSRR